MSPYDNSYNITVGGETLTSPYDQSDLNNQATAKIKDTHIVKAGETLQSIAYQYYGNSGYWHRLVAFNHIINPFKLEPYTKLFIPS